MFLGTGNHLPASLLDLPERYAVSHKLGQVSQPVGLQLKNFELLSKEVKEKVLMSQF